MPEQISTILAVKGLTFWRLSTTLIHLEPIALAPDGTYFSSFGLGDVRCFHYFDGYKSHNKVSWLCFKTTSFLRQMMTLERLKPWNLTCWKLCHDWFIPQNVHNSLMRDAYRICRVVCRKSSNIHNHIRYSINIFLYGVSSRSPWSLIIVGLSLPLLNSLIG